MGEQRKHIILNGFMGVGKSRVGRHLAATLNRPFVDTDALVEQRTGSTIRELFDTRGEAFFRERERDVCREVFGEQTPSIISTGGGALMHPVLLEEARRSGWVVFLQSAPQTILQRVKSNRKRPLLDIEPQGDYEQALLRHIENMLKERQTMYLKSHFTIQRDGMEAEETARMILEYISLLDKEFITQS
ncbi:MAG: shikimate kinase [Calditrichaeota bacterium]|nr:MAG: shikimate kinase [Calditrichota bacterium]